MKEADFYPKYLKYQMELFKDDPRMLGVLKERAEEYNESIWGHNQRSKYNKKPLIEF